MLNHTGHISHCSNGRITEEREKEATMAKQPSLWMGQVGGGSGLGQMEMRKPTSDSKRRWVSPVLGDLRERLKERKLDREKRKSVQKMRFQPEICDTVLPTNTDA